MNAHTLAPLINRVPHIILLYWVIKIASTTLFFATILVLAVWREMRVESTGKPIPELD